jgi:hypothetical protein
MPEVTNKKRTGFFILTQDQSFSVAQKRKQTVAMRDVLMRATCAKFEKWIEEKTNDGRDYIIQVEKDSLYEGQYRLTYKKSVLIFLRNPEDAQEAELFRIESEAEFNALKAKYPDRVWRPFGPLYRNIFSWSLLQNDPVVQLFLRNNLAFLINDHDIELDYEADAVPAVFAEPNDVELE